MKILTLSDSHGYMADMRQYVERFCPDAIIHLGDYYFDATALSREYPEIPMYAVCGNCDRYRMQILEAETRTVSIDGVRFLITHGHLHHVKQSLYPLLSQARAMRVDAALFGHTHVAYCQREEDGLWVVNPGACGYGGSAAIVETENGKIVDCRIYKGI